MKQATRILGFAWILVCTMNLMANDNWSQLQGNAAR